MVHTRIIERKREQKNHTAKESHYTELRNLRPIVVEIFGSISSLIQRNNTYPGENSSTEIRFIAKNRRSDKNVTQ